MTSTATSLSDQDAAVVLGLNAGFTADDVKAAHRRLARQHHPDLGGDADTFRRIQEAFERLRGAGSNGNGSGATTVCGRSVAELGRRDRYAPACESCSGRGYSTEYEDARRTTCHRCAGRGIVVVVPCKFCRGAGCARCKQTGRFWLPKPGTCHACRGIGWTRGSQGRQLHRVCPTCDGSGERAVFNPVIPRGAILR